MVAKEHVVWPHRAQRTPPCLVVRGGSRHPLSPSPVRDPREGRPKKKWAKLDIFKEKKRSGALFRNTHPDLLLRIPQEIPPLTTHPLSGGEGVFRVIKIYNKKRPLVVSKRFQAQNPGYMSNLEFGTCVCIDVLIRPTGAPAGGLVL